MTDRRTTTGNSDTAAALTDRVINMAKTRKISYRKIADVCGISYNTVRRIVDDNKTANKPASARVLQDRLAELWPAPGG
jgi:hypothetical protein